MQWNGCFDALNMLKKERKREIERETHTHTYTHRQTHTHRWTDREIRKNKDPFLLNLLLVLCLGYLSQVSQWTLSLQRGSNWQSQ